MVRFIKYIRVAIVLLLPLLWAGCLKEDYSYCKREGMYICFIPENPKHDYPDLVRTVDLYFYGETGNLESRIHRQKESLRKEDKAVLVKKLPNGKYTMVSVINDTENYLTVNTGRLESIQSFLVKEISSDRLVDFFSGVRELEVAGRTQQTVYTDIFKHNNNIHLEIILDGYEIPPGSNLNSYIEGNNGAYYYLLGTSPEDSFRTYLPYGTQVDQNGISMAFNFCVMRLWLQSDLTLYLMETDASQNTVHTIQLNIVDYLAKVRNGQGISLYDTDKKLSFHDDYKITVKLGRDFILLELLINDWWVIRGGVDV